MSLKEVIAQALVGCAGARLDRPNELQHVAEMVTLAIAKTSEARLVRQKSLPLVGSHPQFVKAAVFLSGEP
jgi:hypothetical protein